MFGFCRNLGRSNVLWSELWGIFTMLGLAWECGVRKLIIEGDSLVAITLINGSYDKSHPYASLVLHIRDLMLKEWEVQCLHIQREANQVVDCLTNMAHSLELGIHVHEAPPPSCRNL